MWKSTGLTCAATLLLLLAAGPAAAGFHFTAAQSSDGMAGVPTSLSIEGWASDGAVRLDFHNGSAPLLVEGSFQVVRDSGKSVLYFDPGDKTYWRADQQATLRAIGTKLQVADPRLEKVVDEDGGPILGHPTRHTLYRVTFKTVSKEIPRFSMAMTIEKETWSAPDIVPGSFEAWLRTGEIPTDDPAFEKLLAGMRETMKGMPLKVAITNTAVATIDGIAESPSVAHFAVEVKSLETMKVDDSRFAIPPGYREKPAPGPPGPGSRR